MATAKKSTTAARGAASPASKSRAKKAKLDVATPSAPTPPPPSAEINIPTAEELGRDLVKEVKHERLNRGGRLKGSKNRATAEVRELAQSFAPDIIITLAEISFSRTYPVAGRVAAMREILDRAFGKAPQALTGEGGGPIGLASVNFDPTKLSTPALREIMELMRTAASQPPSES